MKNHNDFEGDEDTMKDRNRASSFRPQFTREIRSKNDGFRERDGWKEGNAGKAISEARRVGYESWRRCSKVQRTKKPKRMKMAVSRPRAEQPLHDVLLAHSDPTRPFMGGLRRGLLDGLRFGVNQ